MRAYVFTDERLASHAGQFVWLSIDTERLHTGRRKESVGPADAGNPHHRCGAGDHRPGLTAGSGHPGILEAAHHQATTVSGEGTHPVAG